MNPYKTNRPQTKTTNKPTNPPLNLLIPKVLFTTDHIRINYL